MNVATLVVTRASRATACPVGPRPTHEAKVTHDSLAANDIYNGEYLD